MLYGWSQAGSEIPTFPEANALKPYPLSASAGWTSGLADEATYNGLANGFLLPARGTQGTTSLGFVTRPPEKLYYALEWLMTDLPVSAPRMAPVFDDLTIIYSPWEAARVIQEGVIVD